MGNMPKLGGAPEPAGDMGIGLCLACCNLLAAGEVNVMPGFAVVMMPVSLPTGQTIVVPSCFMHLKQQVSNASKPPLLVAGG